ncbi:MAG: GNAT family N-acetyltransferase [Bryobacteraceae bacterium]|nr:GNAT family N-acetyltransferase [Bryobacteraceae bacterium]
MQTTQGLLIREFARGDEAAFRSLNEYWITLYFQMEAKDEEAFLDPQRTIVDAGGTILLAIAGDKCIGCCALVRLSETDFEVAKMAVDPASQGSGVGRRLLKAVIERARLAGAKRLSLETNRKLGAALRLYESAGFQHIPPERVIPSPYARADVSMEMFL